MFDFQWLILRLSALLVILGFIFDIEIIILILGFLFLHINLGLKSIIYDYLHTKKIKLILLILARISMIEISRYFLELLI